MVVKARSCNFEQLFCSSACNIAPHISLHDLPDHRTMKRCPRQVSLNKVAFLLLLRRSKIQTYFCICPQYLCSFRILVECNPNKRGQGRMLVRPIRLLSQVLFHIGSMFCFFPANFMTSTYTDKNSPFSRFCENIPALFQTVYRVPVELSRIASIVILPENDRTDFAQEEHWIFHAGP